MVRPMTNSFNPKLSRRLGYFSNYYSNQDCIWDIGCDHGHLGLSFIQHPKNPFIFLVDPALPVIEKLRKKVEDSDIPRTTIIHDKGQGVKLRKDLSHFIFIAGMGGPEIIEILKNLSPQLGDNDQILISPHTKVLDVREYLALEGDILLKEKVIFDSGIWYPHFLLGKGGRTSSPFGDEIFSDEEGKEYRLHLIEKLSRHRDLKSKYFLNFLKSR